MHVKTVCGLEVHVNAYTSHVNSCLICSDTFEALTTGTLDTILQDLVDQSDLIPSVLRQLISSEIMYITPSMFDKVLQHIHGVRLYPRESRHTCTCGFTCRTRKSFAIHTANCQHYQQFVENTLSIERLQRELASKSLYEYVKEHPPLSYHTALKVVKSYVQAGLLKYDFLDEKTKKMCYKRIFQEGLKRKYGVDNPSRLEVVRQKQRQRQLEQWSQLHVKLDRMNYIVKRDYKQLLEIYSLNSYDDMLRYVYDLLTSSSCFKLVNPSSFSDFVLHKLGDGRTIYEFVCSNCNTRYTKYIPSPASLLQKLQLYNAKIEDIVGCPLCFGTSGKSLLEKSILTDIVNNVSKQLTIQQHVRFNQHEVDAILQLQDRKIGIEIDGLFWHSTAHLKMLSSNYADFLNREYQLRQQTLSKLKFLTQLDFRVLTVDEISWERYKVSYLSWIKYQLGLCERVYARHLELVNVNDSDAQEFHARFNIHGPVKGASKHIGLSKNGQLLCVASFGRNRFSSEAAAELYRLTYYPEVAIVGGFNKLLAHINVPVVTYIDCRLHNIRPRNVIKEPGLAYYIVDWKNHVLRHRLYIRPLVKGCTELEFIFQNSSYDMYFTYGSWRIRLR